MTENPPQNTRVKLEDKELKLYVGWILILK